MSYEGEEEYLCERGHLYGCDVNQIHYGDGIDKVCPHCGSAWKWHHSINFTNGSDKNDPDTIAAPVEEIGFTDVWHKDHYDNDYATKLIVYKPAEGSAWRLIADEEAEQKRRQEEFDRSKRWYIEGWSTSAHSVEPAFLDYYYGQHLSEEPALLEWDTLPLDVIYYTSKDAAEIQRKILATKYPSFELRVGFASLSSAVQATEEAKCQTIVPM